MEFVNGKDDILYMKWKIKNIWNHQPGKFHNTMAIKMGKSLITMGNFPCLITGGSKFKKVQKSCWLELESRNSTIQWQLQDPKLEVHTMYKAYCSGLCKWISQQNMAKNMVLTYLHFRILEFPLNDADHVSEITIDPMDFAYPIRLNHLGDSTIIFFSRCSQLHPLAI